MKQRLALSVLALLLAAAAAWAAPDWPPDPANSRWLDLGVKAEPHGLFQIDSTSEGTLQPTTRAGRPCWEVVPTPKEKGGGGGRYWYFHLGAWADWVQWLGENDVDLAFVYYDGKPGRVHLAYDSSDPSVVLVPHTPGAWRAPEALPDGCLELKGTGQWQTRTVPLPLALFQKRCNGGDFRFGSVPADSDFALAGVAVTRVPRRQAPTPGPGRLSLPLSFVTGDGAVVEGRRTRLPGQYVQDGDAPIAIEAEAATSLQAEDRGGVGLDATASGGAYIHFVPGAEYRFTVAAPGRYQAWERARFPFPGSWNHTEMIGDQSAVVIDSNSGPAKVWTWVKAGTYDLEKGATSLRLSYLGGAELDQIVFLPVTAPAPTAPLPAAPNLGPTEGWAETAEVRPLDVKQWLAFALETLPGALGGAVTVQYSADAGKTYQALPADGSLAAVATAGGGKDRVRFRVTLRRPADGPAPFAQAATVTCTPGPDNQVRLANAVAALTFNADGLVALEHLRTGHRYTRPGAQAPLFVVGVKKPGPAPVQDLSTAAGSLEDYTIRETRGGKRLTLAYRLANGITATAGIVLDPSGVTRWTLEIANPTDLEVATLEFPILPGVRLGDDPADDTLFFPRCWGQVWTNPVTRNLGGYLWGPHMRWLDLWDKTDGLYVGVHDGQLNDTGFGPTPDSATSLRLPVKQRILVKPHGRWTSGERVVAFHGGDWHQGADLYRAYVAKALKPPDPAEWVRWIDAWGTQSSNEMPYKGWGALPEDGDRLGTEGLELMAANRQMMDGMDSGYCGLYLYPALGWGTTREFAQQLAALRRRGLHYTPYMNWHLWAPGYGHHPRCGITPWASMPADAPRRDDAWWQKVAARSFDGSFPAVVDDRYAQMDADIGAPEWCDRLADWTRRYLEWNADGMYYDQFNMNYFSGRLPPDYATYGFWTRATLDTLRRIKDDARKSDPYYVSSGEAYMDSLGQALDLHMTSGVVNRLEFYAYCNPRQLFIDGSWNGGFAEAFGGYERVRFVWQVGGRFEQMAGPEPWRAGVLALRRRVKSLLYRAEFRDTVGLTLTDGQGQPAVAEIPQAAIESEPAACRGLSARWFLRRDGKERAAIVNVINTHLDDRATLTLSTREFGPVRAAWASTLEDAFTRLDGRQEGDTYRVTLPRTEMASLLLVNRCAPLVRWHADPTLCPGGTGDFKLTLTNLEPEPCTANVALKPPAGWPPASAKVGPVAPGTSAQVSLLVRVPARAALGRYDLHAKVATKGGTFTAYSMVAVAEPLLAEFRGDPGTYHLLIRNLTDTPVRGTVAVSAPAPLRVAAPATFEIALPLRGAEAKVPVTVEGQDQLTQIAEMSARVVTPLAEWTLVRAVMPIVPNGDFEMDGAGDGRPDWWMARKLADAWDPERMRLDTGAPSGQHCLRVEPSDDPMGFVRAYAVNGAVTPTTHYRFSAWVKRASAEGDAAVLFSGFDWRSLTSTKVGEWERLTGEFTTGPKHGAMIVSCCNRSRGPAWFDGIKVEEIK